MNRTGEFAPDTILPEMRDVFKSQGIPEDSAVPDSIVSLYESAVRTFSKSVQARFILSELTIEEFRSIFVGEGENAPDVLLKNIYTKANHLAVYALTMGQKISDRISHLFDTNEFALGSMLDAVASNAADRASRFCEQRYHQALSSDQSNSEACYTLGYSPGYCGWHISGQRKLFRFLKPEKIGITLNDACLMTPLKSISGLLVDGDKDIHLFNCTFSFCIDCKNKSCLDRMKKLTSINTVATAGS